MIRTIALDDEPPALEVLHALCADVDFIELQKTFSSASEAMKYIRKQPVDLLLLDVNMPSISGLDFIKELPRKIHIVLTTAYPEYAVEGFNLEVADYLLKPIAPARFRQAMEKVRMQMDLLQQQPEQTFLYIRADYSLIKIAVEDLLYIEGLDDYLKIHIENHRTVVTRMTMKGIMEKLPANFIRVHRSFIVPIERIERFRNKTIFMGKTEIPVSASYEKDLKARLNPDG
ncbi:LytR/AlgR family response regulator transcription factor [Flavobacterium silvaticum]|uniref:Response regulator transcription factor n=1 Tax=Flavobacterium silvaticum TaxID=1852020 RepID=A0A972FLX9_9FLAO|nr:LytTR family DNA-binding domain-containing protein [Flavobacterium silvaticum]NMH28426.1 response regulator transcription factor [Flavobacterium silvaticum]